MRRRASTELTRSPSSDCDSTTASDRASRTPTSPGCTSPDGHGHAWRSCATPAYRYRRRADESSLVQAGWYQPERFTEIPRYGHLDLLRHVRAARGAIPIWLQNLVLYDLFYPSSTTSGSTRRSRASIPAPQSASTSCSPRSCGYIDTATIENYRVSVASSDIRNALIIGVKRERTRPDRIRLDRIDADQRLAQLRYYFGGDLPREQFRCRGQVTTPAHSKSRPITFLGRHMVSERIVWLPADGRDRRHARWPPDADRDRRRHPGAVRRRSSTAVAAARLGGAGEPLRRRAAYPPAAGRAASRRLVLDGPPAGCTYVPHLPPHRGAAARPQAEPEVQRRLGVHRPPRSRPGQRRAPVPLCAGSTTRRSMRGS